MTSKRFISVTPDVHSKLEKLFSVSKLTIQRALRYYNVNSPLAPRIRKAALENGGVTMCLTPECETIHDSGGHMIQRFPNGATLFIDKLTGMAQLTSHAGDIIATRHDCTVPDIASLQQIASAS